MLPLRDTFAVLFFVAVGMLFDPGVIVREPLALAAIVAVIIWAKPARLRADAADGPSARTSWLVALGTAQIGEFSFVLAGLGRQLE